MPKRTRLVSLASDWGEETGHWAIGWRVWVRLVLGHFDVCGDKGVRESDCEAMDIYKYSQAAKHQLPKWSQTICTISRSNSSSLDPVRCGWESSCVHPFFFFAWRTRTPEPYLNGKFQLFTKSQKAFLPRYKPLSGSEQVFCQTERAAECKKERKIRLITHSCRHR